MSHQDEPQYGADGERLDLEHAGSFNNRHSLDTLSENVNRKRAAVYATTGKAIPACCRGTPNFFSPSSCSAA